MAKRIISGLIGSTLISLLVFCLFYLLYLIPISSSQLEAFYSIQCDYPELKDYIDECLSDDVVTQWEFNGLLSMVEKIDISEKMDRIKKYNNRQRPLEELKNDWKKELDAINGET